MPVPYAVLHHSSDSNEILESCLVHFREGSWYGSVVPGILLLIFSSIGIYRNECVCVCVCVFVFV